MDALALLEFSDQMVVTHMQVSADIFYTGPQAQVTSRLGAMGILTGAEGVPARFSDAEYLDIVSARDVYAASERMLIVNRHMLAGLRQMESAMSEVVAILSEGEG